MYQRVDGEGLKNLQTFLGYEILIAYAEGIEANVESYWSTAFYLDCTQHVEESPYFRPHLLLERSQSLYTLKVQLTEKLPVNRNEEGNLLWPYCSVQVHSGIIYKILVLEDQKIEDDALIIYDRVVIFQSLNQLTGISVEENDGGFGLTLITHTLKNYCGVFR